MLARSFVPGNYDKGEMGVAAVSLFWHFNLILLFF